MIKKAAELGGDQRKFDAYMESNQKHWPNRGIGASNFKLRYGLRDESRTILGVKKRV